MLHLAESIGKHIAQGRVPTWSDLTWLPESGYTYIHTKPYKEIENALGLWQGFLRNFANSSKPIYLISTGNSQEIKLIIGFPNDQINYAESLFFAHFPTSDWMDSKFIMPEHVRFLNFGESKVCSDADFTKNGLYADPWKDVLSLYESIPAENQLHIINRVVFNKKKGFLEKLVKNVKDVKNLLPEKTEGDKPKEEKKPEDVTATIKFSTGWAVDGPHSLWELVEGKVKAVYTKYLVSGTMKIGNNSQIVQLNMNQVINFFHFPTKEFTSTILSVSGYRKLPAPTRIPTLENVENKNDLTVLGYTEYKSNPKMFGIKREDKLRHMYIIGMTGTGKSKFIANMVRSDMISNKGVCVMDPHGDLIDDILSQVPSYRTNDVVLFDVADRDFPVGFNVFECDSDEQKPLIASGIVGIFKKMFGNSRGPRLEYILRNVIFALLEYPGATFLDLIRMLTDDNYKEEILSHVKDPIILKFWRDEYDKYQPKQREEAVAPITNKVGQFTSSTIVRNIFGQSRTKMKFRQMMDEGKIILVNLSKGKIGEDSMAMIGSFIASKIQIDAMSRADIDESQRRDFYLYIDEFQNFATESFASILSEARKYKLSLIVANQYISQIDEPIRNAIFGNVGTIIGNRIGKDDAEIMAGQFKGMVTTNDFLSLPNQRCYIKLMIDGMVSDPFSMKTAQFVKYEDFQVIKEKVREQSRQRYAMPRQELETLMQVWANKKFTMAEKIAEKAAAEGKAWAGGSPASAGYPSKAGPTAGPAVPPVKQGPVGTTSTSPISTSSSSTSSSSSSTSIPTQSSTTTNIPKADTPIQAVNGQHPVSQQQTTNQQSATPIKQVAQPTPPVTQELQKIEPVIEAPKPKQIIKKDLGPIMAMPYPADKPVEISSLKPIQKKVENKIENKDAGKQSQLKNTSGTQVIETNNNKVSENKVEKNNEEKVVVPQKDIFKKPTIHDIIYANPEEKIELPIVETIKKEKADAIKPDTIIKKVEEKTGEVVAETASPEPKKRGRPKKVVVEESRKDDIPTVEANDVTIQNIEQEDVRSIGSASPQEYLLRGALHSGGQQTESDIHSGGQDNEILRRAQDDGSQIQDNGSQIQDEIPQQFEVQQQDDYVPRDGSEGFSIKNVKLGEWYNGYVKLMYNYGIFVTVLGVEGLIHKKNIRELHPDISRKKIYNIGDPIRVKAEEFTEVNGEKRVIWTQMGDDF